MVYFASQSVTKCKEYLTQLLDVGGERLSEILFISGSKRDITFLDYERFHSLAQILEVRGLFRDMYGCPFFRIQIEGDITMPWSVCLERGAALDFEEKYGGEYEIKSQQI